jgi:ribosome-associated protein
MQTEQLCQLILKALEDLKAKDIVVLDVTALTQITDYMIICSGTSNRHVKSIADNVITEAKQNKACFIGMEGEDTGEWVLVDLDDAIVHIMLPKVREFYQLEKLWDIKPEQTIANEE